VLAGKPFVEAIQASRVPNVYLVRVTRGSTNQLISALVQAGLELSGVRRSSDDLDEVYRRYFHREEVAVG
ncbi:MAG TPA: hypothetical protein VFT54_05905, partial [Acidimicrobiia bacterium]|nr:hypothetical protein [Acidimicrobiia bacterium]